MEAIEFLKAKNRMTKTCGIHCSDCPLADINNEEEVNCVSLEQRYPEVAVAIIKKWTEEHPAKTRQSEFSKIFPVLELDCNQVVNICPRKLVVAYQCELPSDDIVEYFRDEICEECRKKFWLEEIE